MSLDDIKGNVCASCAPHFSAHEVLNRKSSSYDFKEKTPEISDYIFGALMSHDR